MIRATPMALLAPSLAAGRAMMTAPLMPTARPMATPREGTVPESQLATRVAKRGLAPFNIPVRAELTRCSAKGKSVNGKANQRTPSQKTEGQSARSTDLRAEGKQARVRKPMTMRTKATPLGPMARSPSAMKRNDAPQIRPGRMSKSQPEFTAR